MARLLLPLLCALTHVWTAEQLSPRGEAGREALDLTAASMASSTTAHGGTAAPGHTVPSVRLRGVDADRMQAEYYGKLKGRRGNEARSLQSVTAAYYKVLDWGSCNAPCGGGSMTRLVVCWGNLTNRETDAAQCAGLDRPVRRKDCNLQLCPSLDVTEFSCDPDAIGGSRRCGPLQRDGGRLFFSIHAANSVPQSDMVLAGFTDPYVVIKVGGHTWRTSAVKGSLNPRWGGLVRGGSPGQSNGETFFAGLRLSGTPVTFELWDSDSGLEGEDDLLGVMKTVVIGCSFSSASCDEKTWLPLRQGQDCFIARNATRPNRAQPCVQVRQFMTAHNVTIDPLNFSPELEKWNISLSLSNPHDQQQPSAALIHSGESKRLDTAFADFAPAKQGLIVTQKQEVEVWNVTNVTYGATIEVNYKSWAYLFRFTGDGSWKEAEPSWIAEDGWRPVHPQTGAQVLARAIGSPSGTHQFRAHVRYQPSFTSFRFGPLATYDTLNRSVPVPQENAFVVLRVRAPTAQCDPRT